jgi:thioredoxin family protein
VVHTITVVHTAACHFCDEARAALGEASRDHSIRVEYVSATSPDGMRLVAAHRVGMFPLVLVDGQLFSTGRLPRGKLRHLLGDAQTQGAGGGR